MITKWLLTLFGYDGILPALVIFLPACLFWIGLPLGFIEATAILLPVIAFLFRMLRGLQTVDTNQCPSWFRSIQKIALFLGLFPLAVVDAFAILTWRMPKGALGANDYIVAVAIYACYLLLMAVVTYPGKQAPTSTEA